MPPYVGGVVAKIGAFGVLFFQDPDRFLSVPHIVPKKKKTVLPLTLITLTGM